MIPSLNERGVLPPGQHPCDWTELIARYGTGGRRQKLIVGLLAGLQVLKWAGCLKTYIDGSFVTAKLHPNDVDVAYEAGETELFLLRQLDPVFFDFSSQRFQQRKKYSAEFFLADTPCDPQGRTFLDFFQEDRDGSPKGILVLNLEALP